MTENKIKIRRTIKSGIDCIYLQINGYSCEYKFHSSDSITVYLNDVKKTIIPLLLIYKQSFHEYYDLDRVIRVKPEDKCVIEYDITYDEVIDLDEINGIHLIVEQKKMEDRGIENERK